MIAPIAMFENKLFTAIQFGSAAVISVVFQIPPPTLPAKTVLPVGSFKSTHNDLVLPPQFFGPTSTQFKLGILPATKLEL